MVGPLTSSEATVAGLLVGVAVVGPLTKAEATIAGLLVGVAEPSVAARQTVVEAERRMTKERVEEAAGSAGLRTVSAPSLEAQEVGSCPRLAPRAASLPLPQTMGVNRRSELVVHLPHVVGRRLERVESPTRWCGFFGWS